MHNLHVPSQLTTSMQICHDEPGRQGDCCTEGGKACVAAYMSAPKSLQPGRLNYGADRPHDAPCSRLAPALNQQEEVYLRSLTELAGSVLGFDAHLAGAPGLEELLAFVRLALNPTAQVRHGASVQATIVACCVMQPFCVHANTSIASWDAADAQKSAFKNQF